MSISAQKNMVCCDTDTDVILIQKSITLRFGNQILPSPMLLCQKKEKQEIAPQFNSEIRLDLSTYNH